MELIGFVKMGKNSQVYNKYRCHCGVEFVTRRSSVRSGHTTSCGCNQRIFMRSLAAYTLTTHGMTGSKEYNAWQSMKQRCYDTKCRNYHDYGGRGITVCDRWLNSFENFFEDMGRSADDLSLERIDNDQGYYRDNCKWATRSEQNLNRRAF